MSMQVTDYTNYITQTEQEILASLNSSFGDPKVVQEIFQEIITQKKQNQVGFNGIYSSGEDIANIIKTTSINIGLEQLNELITKVHTRNNDTKLQGVGPNSIDNTGLGNIVSFKFKGVEVAYIAADGSFVGKIDGLDTNEIASKLESTITSEDVLQLIKNKLDKTEILDIDGKIKTETLNDEIILREEYENHVIGTTHLTAEERINWNNKFNMPENGLTSDNLSTELNDLINDSYKSLLNAKGYIFETNLDFGIIARKEDVDAMLIKVEQTILDIEDIQNNINENENEINAVTDIVDANTLAIAELKLIDDANTLAIAELKQNTNTIIEEDEDFGM